MVVLLSAGGRGGGVPGWNRAARRRGARHGRGAVRSLPGAPAGPASSGARWGGLLRGRRAHGRGDGAGPGHGCTARGRRGGGGSRSPYEGGQGGRRASGCRPVRPVRSDRLSRSWAAGWSGGRVGGAVAGGARQRSGSVVRGELWTWRCTPWWTVLYAVTGCHSPGWLGGVVVWSIRLRLGERTRGLSRSCAGTSGRGGAPLRVRPVRRDRLSRPRAQWWPGRWGCGWGSAPAVWLGCARGPVDVAAHRLLGSLASVPAVTGTGPSRRGDPAAPWS